MRQAAILAVYLFAQAGFVGGAFWFAWTELREISPALFVGFSLFLLFEVWMAFIYVLAPLMVWAKRVDDRKAWERMTGRRYPN